MCPFEKLVIMSRGILVDKGYVIFYAPCTVLQEVDCIKGGMPKEPTTKVQKL
jgi:hypothetical protein